MPEVCLFNKQIKYLPILAPGTYILVDLASVSGRIKVDDIPGRALLGQFAYGTKSKHVSQ